jgi:hypothetical protein
MVSAPADSTILSEAGKRGAGKHLLASRLDDPRGLFASVAEKLDTAKRVIVQLGCDSDPCFLAPLAIRLLLVQSYRLLFG